MAREFVYDHVDRAEALALARLRAHTEPGEFHMLTDVETFLPSFEYVGQETMPLLAFAATLARPAPPSGGGTFKIPWEMIVRFRAIVDTNDPATGRPEVRNLAGRAMHSLTTDPDTGDMAWSLDDEEDTGISYRLDFGPYELTVAPGRVGNLLEARSAMTVKFESSY